MEKIIPDQNIRPQIVGMLKIQRDGLAIISLILLLTTFLLSVRIFTYSNETVIIPTLSPDKAVVYNKSQISKEYLTELTLDITHMLLDISPDNVLSQYQRLRMHFLPEKREELVGVLRRIKDNVTNKRLTTFFTTNIEEMRVNQSDLEVIVSGKLNTLTYNTVTAKEDRIYKINYQFYRNRLYVSSISEVENEEQK